MGKLLSLKERAEFFYHLARLSEVGGNVSTWVSTWQPLTKRGESCRRQLLFWLRAGFSLAASMRKVGGFDLLELSLVALGESSGTLNKIFNMLAESRNSQLELKKRIKSELMMPAIELLAAFIAVVIVIFIVFPRFEAFLTDANLMEKIPSFSRNIFEAAHFLRRWGGLLLVGGVITIIAGLRWLRTNYGVLLKVPYIKNVVRFRLYSILFLYISMLVKTGISLPRCFRLIEVSFTEDPLVSRVARRIRLWLDRDYSLHHTFALLAKQSELFTQEVVSLVALGEKYGQLVSIAERAFNMYSKELERALQNLARLSTPLTLVVISGLVVCLIIGIMVPIFQIAFSVAGG